MILKDKRPRILTFVTTFRCTARCGNCCYQCSSENVRMMSLSEMKNYLDSSLEYYSSSLKMLVLTGGEPFLLGGSLDDIIEYATKKGLKTRVVTNAFWATSFEKSYDRLTKLWNRGLTEINFSTGDEHQEWIPFGFVRNAILASVKIGLTCAVNVETHDNSSFSFERKVEGDPVLRKCLDSRLVIIEHGAWISIGKKLNTFNKGYMQTKSMPCPSILDTIAINPFGEILACCGLTSEQNPYLRLGNINNIGVKEAYEKSFQDIVKIWLSVDGPNRILNYVNNKKGNSEMEYKDHMCRICSKLFSDKSNIDILKTFNHEYSPSVYLKYVLTNKLTDNEEKTN